MGRPAAFRAFAFASTFSVADSAMAAMRGEIGASVARGTAPESTGGTRVRFRARPVSVQTAGVTIRIVTPVQGGTVLLTDKVMVVTGGNSGIGAAIVRAAAAEGAKV